MLPAMANSIVRKLVALVFVLTLAVGGTPVAMAASRTSDCGMASMDMQMSMSQDQHGTPLEDHRMPSKDMGSVCATTCGCALALPQTAYTPVLASRPAMPGWALQAEFASVFSRPDLPPPIAIL